MNAYRVETTWKEVRHVGASDPYAAINVAFPGYQGDDYDPQPVWEIENERLRGWQFRVRDRHGAYTYFA